MTAADWPVCTDPLAMFRHLRGAPRLSPSRWFRWATADPPPLPRDKLDQLLDAIADAQADPLDKFRLFEMKGYLAAGVPFAVTEGGLAELLVTAGLAATHEQVIANALTDRRHDPELADAVRCLFADPFAPPPDFAPWRTRTVIAIAEGIVSEAAFDRLPVLADALEDAGCDHAPVLRHLRGNCRHHPGCHALAATLGR